MPEIPYLYDMARRLTGSTTEAEDLVQDTLVRAFGAIERFDGERPRPWLVTILRNANINRLRRHRPEIADTDPDTLIALEDSVDEITAQRELAEAVADLLPALPAPFRDVLDLVDGRGLSYAEAAATLHIPIGTVMSRLHRARQRLRTRLAERGLTQPTRPRA